MLLLNFSHPLTASQRNQIEALAGQPIAQVLDVAVHFDEQQPFAPQVAALLAALPLSAVQWQSEAILLVPPAYNFIAAALLAELHGRMGYFPALVRLRPLAGSVVRQFEVAEILDLQQLRERGRRSRSGEQS